MKLRQRTFIWLLAQDDQNETPATGCKGSEKHLGLSCKELSLQTLQQTQSEGMRCPSTGTSPWLHVISFCLQRCQCFLWLSWHQIKSASHFDSTDLSTGDGRAFFLQFSEDMIHAVKVKLHTLQNVTASKHWCGATSIALAANGNSCMQPPALTSTLMPFEEEEGE